MAIIKKYKLGDIGTFKGGISTLNKERYGQGVKFLNYMDIFRNFYIDDNINLKKYNAKESEIEKYNCLWGDAFFTASSETPDEIAFSTLYLSSSPAIFNGFSKRFRFDHNILLPKYASYLFRSNSFRHEVQKYATGYTRFNISQQDLQKVIIQIPDLNTQQSIIDIIEPIEKIISILEKIISKINKKEILIQNFNSDSTNNKIKNIITKYSNGYAYKKTDIIDAGKYKIFKIRNILDKQQFELTNLEKNNLAQPGDVITGLSGTIGSADIITDNNWVNNQRTLLLRTDYSLQVKSAIEYYKNILLTNATGAAQKNITHNDIMDLNIYIDKYEKHMKNYNLSYVNKLKIINKLKILKNYLINFLIK
ncbi:restriction endonuclease subunit S [Spiroplasma endosymbiont of Amphibalanus improvisus]|uniref:restriction endonuclease subunit S n=1 Tax=Spiroplasma endosymbiont of Amphibalanus improvisus TaxID=3066327 RepID=UPI00313B26CE